MRSVSFHLVLACAAIVVASGCQSSEKGVPKVTDDDGAGGGGGGGGEDKDAGTRPPQERCEPPEILKDQGDACGCNDECASDFCIDGVCCTGECAGTCVACNVPGKAGTCSPIPEGQPPVVAGQCERQDPGTCGLDGSCDGNGACRKYLDGSVCLAGKCEGATVAGGKVCNGGVCQAGPNVICAPFGCSDKNAECFEDCIDNAQCAQGQTCEQGSCGEKKLGAKCDGNGECESNFCADGVCCNTACDAACVSCNQIGKMGECGPVAKDLPDPNGICKIESKTSCGTSGVCDGSGSCSKHAAGTTCGAARCEGGSGVPMSTCDGMGSCKAGAPINCSPFVCTGNSCKETCSSNSDCSTGNVCQNGSCGKKGRGQNCGGGAECQSGNCVDGVCCESACTGLCRYCAAPSSPGRCVNVAPGLPDPRAAAGETNPARACLDGGPAACQRNGMCSGSAGCQLYAQGTECAGESCSSSTNVYKASSLCDGAGICMTGSSRTCSPFKCNGSRCADACGANGDCVAPNTCNPQTSSCGKKPLAGLCSSDNECSSGHCSQGVCCQVKCDGSCFSCKIAQSVGQCTPVPGGGLDPTGLCKDEGASSCGFEGICNGSGACSHYAEGTICKAASCTNGQATRPSTCDGAGNCDASTPRPCNPYVCDDNGIACFASCVDNTQCSGVNTCQAGGMCGKKPVGANCQDAAECSTNFCVDGFCCDQACTGKCRTCQLTGDEGKCSNIGMGMADPDGGCVASAPTTCGDNGLCDGNGGCEAWAATTQCRAQSCATSTSTLILPAKCDGEGSCPTQQAGNCGVYLCDPSTGNSCLSSCGGDQQCVSGNYCSNMSCGLLPKGASCGATSECKSGLTCLAGVCCGSSACGPCETCGSGDCAAVMDGPDQDCAATTMVPLCQQLTGSCLGGQCGVTAAGTGCGSTCVDGGTASQARECNGAGACVAAGAKTSCGAYQCEQGTGLCAGSCMNDADCAANYGCKLDQSGQNGVCKQNQGQMCTGNGDCKSGSCEDQTCCAQMACPACHSCANGSGTCAPVSDGVNADCDPQTSGNLCMIGSCAGGACAIKACARQCMVGNTKVKNQICDPVDGVCKGEAGPGTDCGDYYCDPAVAACMTACAGDGDCRNGTVCVPDGGGIGRCVPP